MHTTSVTRTRSGLTSTNGVHGTVLDLLKIIEDSLVTDKSSQIVLKEFLFFTTLFLSVYFVLRIAQNFSFGLAWGILGGLKW